MFPKIFILLGALVVSGRKQSIKIVEDKKTDNVYPAYSQTVADTKPCGDGALMEVTFKLDEETDKIYGNADDFPGHVATEGDVFEYEIMWTESSTHANVDLEAVMSNWRLRDEDSIKDQNGYINHCEKTTLNGLANGKFYTRKFDLTPASGKHMNTLAFAANPAGNEKEVSMLVRSIRITRKSGAALEIWNSRMAPLTIRSYFPGTIETTCKSSYVIQSNATCNAVEDLSGVIRNGSAPIPIVFGSNATCVANVTVNAGSSPVTPVLAVTAVEVLVKHRGMELPLLANVSLGVSDNDLISEDSAPVTVSTSSFRVGDATCSELLLSIYKESVLVFAAIIRDTASDAVHRKMLLQAPVRLMCGEYADILEEEEEEEEEREKEKEKTPAEEHQEDFEDALEGQLAAMGIPEDEFEALPYPEE
eukprot:TRINITY_DN25239_c0_g1_i1.p1 TRINITY_DN25239_c0_g1~~TRINITY_DN25239_c0_g1_i1.p1  ORF type:complete len:434 (+),score=110.53 TRINITY_DN25239_c0_g1_i1:45-1304(+)